jgi:hypothetical protein
MTQRRIETMIEIEAPTERVWALLTDFARMPSWNPFITSISGTLMQGARLSMQVTPPGKSPMQFKPIILSFQPEREFRWLGTLFAKGIFDGEHYFLLEAVDEDRTRLIHGEKFSGLLVGFMSGMLSATEQGFLAMNAALKQQAEEKRSLNERNPKGTKKWWQSKGIIGGLGTMAVGGAMLAQGLYAFFAAQPDQQVTAARAAQALFANMSSLGTIATGFLAWYGRVSATDLISKDRI